jgi:hypothetical protein
MDQPNADLDTLVRAELERELQTTLDELDDLDEMRLAVLGQTGVHIGAVLLGQYNARFDRSQARLEERAAKIRARLLSLESGSAP